MGGYNLSFVSSIIFIVTLVISIGIFLLLRNFWCWYFKINKIVSLLEEQNNLISQLLRSGTGYAYNQSFAPPPQSYVNQAGAPPRPQGYSDQIGAQTQPPPPPPQNPY
jgi:hypothetical protein